MLGKRVLVGAFAGVSVLATAGAAMAVSDGNYDYRKQHCSASAANYTTADEAEEGCRTLSADVWTGPNGAYSEDNELASAGILQTPDGTEPSEPDANGPGATAADHAAEGLHVYFGADDNLDNGEHDSSPLVDNGPSDGGGIQANLDPASLTRWLAALSSGDTAYLLSHPVPLFSAGIGAGADGIMFSAQTERQVAWQGTGTTERDVADYEGKEWDPESCAGPSDGSLPENRTDCDDPATHRPEDITYWEAKEGRTYAEPGVQVYEDPDPQGSPLGPYPLTAVYVGTCGAIVGGGDVQAPASPVTNGAGQLAVKTGC